MNGGRARAPRRDGTRVRGAAVLAGVVLAGALSVASAALSPAMAQTLGAPQPAGGTARSEAPAAAPPAAASAAPFAPPSTASTTTPTTAASTAADIDALVRQGEDPPAAALAAIDALPVSPLPARRRQQALAAAEVATRSADQAEGARRRAAAVQAAQALGGVALARADEQYLAALRAEHEDLGAVAERARVALGSYDVACGPPAVPAVPDSRYQRLSGAAPASRAGTDCDYRPRWRLLQLLSAHARQQHAPPASRQHARAALELAAAAADAWRQAWSETDLALAAAQERDGPRAQQHLDRAQRHAEPLADPRLDARLAIAEGNLARDLDDPPRADAAQRRALDIARAAQLPRLEATALVNLSDAAVQSGRAAAALETALQGLAAARPLQIKRIERALLNNAMLARVALGRRAEALADFEALQAAWAQDGATGMQVTSMREYGDALARAGDLKGALELHHREVDLTRKLMAANREAALAELRTRYDRETQQRGILLLEHDNALKSAALENQALTRRLWALGAGVLVLAIALMLLLLHRVRAGNRALEDSRARLRVQTERDTLTGLANRRRLQSMLQAGRAPDGGFQGALLMIDIDHFKRINDEHGHGAGDQVLVQVAQRIGAAVRQSDTVARWGGEEFLVLAPALQRSQQRADVDVLAQRLLQAVAGTPVALPGGVLVPVSVSIGHALFPLPPHQVRLEPEQAVNLADMALYTAKSQGRNCAVGIVATTAADAAALRALEADFERAWHEGRVQLHVDRGPAPQPTGSDISPGTDTTATAPSASDPEQPHHPTTEETHR